MAASFRLKPNERIASNFGKRQTYHEIRYLGGKINVSNGREFFYYFDLSDKICMSYAWKLSGISCDYEYAAIIWRG